MALVPRTVLGSPPSLVASAPPLGAVENLCPGERFADQPVAAFCSGVLVDWDLVLTAGHCAQALPLQDFVVVFGYYYEAPGQLALQPSDVREPVEIVSERVDPEGAQPRLDYAWLRLNRPADPPRQPASVYVRPPPLSLLDPVVAIGASSGVPIKIDEGGKIQDLRSGWSDYFICDTDTSGGASGGGAFDAQQALLGVLARGGPDYVETSSGCRVTVQEPDGSAAQEQFTYGYRAVDGLCTDVPGASSLCRADCTDPCKATTPPPAAGGCAIATGGDTTDPLVAAAVGAAMASAMRRKRGWRHPRRRWLYGRRRRGLQ